MISEAAKSSIAWDYINNRSEGESLKDFIEREYTQDVSFLSSGEDISLLS